MMKTKQSDENSNNMVKPQLQYDENLGTTLWKPQLQYDENLGTTWWKPSYNMMKTLEQYVEKNQYYENQPPVES